MMMKSNQFIYQPTEVTKSSTKRLEYILAKWPIRGFKNRLRVASKIYNTRHDLFYIFYIRRQHHVSQIALKFGLRRSTSSSPILPQSDPPQLLWMENCSRTIRDSAMVTMQSLYKKPPSLFLTVSSMTPTIFPSPKLGPKCTVHGVQVQLRDACCHLAKMIEVIDDISLSYEWAERCRLLPNYFGPSYRACHCRNCTTLDDHQEGNNIWLMPIL